MRVVARYNNMRYRVSVSARSVTGSHGLGARAHYLRVNLLVDGTVLHRGHVGFIQLAQLILRVSHVGIVGYAVRTGVQGVLGIVLHRNMGDVCSP